MKNVIKKWWFWAIIIITIICLMAIAKSIIEKISVNKSIETIGKEITDYSSGTENVKLHLDEFSYNYETEKVEYKPNITLEMYNRINESMTEKEVVNILGKGEKLQNKEKIGFLINWGNLDLSILPCYHVQIVFNDSGKVISKSQLGLK